MSGYIEIDVKAGIFDDPEYCEDDVRSCLFIRNGHLCGLFGGYLAEGKRGNFGNLWLKCDECKAAWNKAKESGTN